MKKVNRESTNIKENNLSLLKELFPEIFKDGELDFEALKESIGIIDDDKNEKYNFSWNGKSKAIKLFQKTTTGTLLPCKSKSKNWDKTENIYIEGDNLEVLKILQKSYNKKIKMIYIDPPYNTGNDFIYKDDFTDNIKNYIEQTHQEHKAHVETDGRFHTDWLNMMYPRIRLAKNLLTDDGIMFISCDDNELANLIKICDEIFGQNNFISIMPRKTVEHIRILADYEMQNLNDYILVYCKSKDQVKLIKKVIGLIKYEYKDEHGAYTLKAFQNSGANGTRSARPNLYYEIYYNEKSNKFSLENDGESIKILPKKVGNEDGRWLWSKEKFEKDSNLLEYKNGRIYRKSYFLKDEDQNKYQAEKTWLDKFPNRLGAKTLVDLDMGGYFDYSKPVELIQLLVRIATNEDDIILDFFSGSGTTAHAVLNQNYEDNSRRKYIMIQLPEIIDKNSQTYKDGYKTICDIGEERIRRAALKIESTTKYSQDYGFKVFKLDSSNIKIWQEESLNEDNALTLFKQHENPIVDGRTEEDLLYEILLKEGIMLSSLVEEKEIDGTKIYSINKGYMIVCLNDKIDIELVREIGKLKPETVIFKDSGFLDENAKTNALQELKKVGIDEQKVKSI